MPARLGLAALIVVLSSLPATAQEGPVYTLDSLARLPWCELERIYRDAEPGTRPEGFHRGKVVHPSCEFLSGPRAGVSNFLWQGKHFCDATLINQWRGMRLIKAEVAPGESWLDGRPAHILDYQHSSKLWADVRDETREVSPGVYIGAMYLRRCPQPRLKVLFLLEKSPCR
jgi:hypothetical protein